MKIFCRGLLPAFTFTLQAIPADGERMKKKLTHSIWRYAFIIFAMLIVARLNLRVKKNPPLRQCTSTSKQRRPFLEALKEKATQTSSASRNSSKLLEHVVYSEEELISAAITDGLTIWLASPGGSGLNMLVKSILSSIDELAVFGKFDGEIVTDAQSTPLTPGVWTHKLCHYYKPLHSNGIEFAVFIYRKPRETLQSLVRRKLLRINFDKMKDFEHRDMEYNLTNAIKLFRGQLQEWLSAEVNYPILTIKYETFLTETDMVSKLLGVPLHVPPKINDTRGKQFVRNGQELENLPGFAEAAYELLNWESLYNHSPNICLR